MRGTADEMRPSVIEDNGRVLCPPEEKGIAKGPAPTAFPAVKYKYLNGFLLFC